MARMRATAASIFLLVVTGYFNEPFAVVILDRDIGTGGVLDLVDDLYRQDR